MNVLFLSIVVILFFILAYTTYANFLRDKIFNLFEIKTTPAHELNDGMDYVPTKKPVLFGHHFTSIAGLGPIMGPAIAVIWGWLPAMIWVALGAVFIGAVHDFGALAISLRYRGISIGTITREVINPRARLLFLLIIFFLLSLAMGVFSMIIAILFTDLYPQAVIPTFALMFIAVLVGLLVYRYKVRLIHATWIGLLLMFIMVWAGIQMPVAGVGKNVWVFILIAYAFIASVLPVWLLLQPRDYLNSYKLYIGLGLMYLGIIITPKLVMAAPAINHQASNLPPLFPFLFIIIACGAISGFHNLISSGTTAKQLNSAKDAKMIGYGGMLAEALLATFVIIACCAGVGNTAAWHVRYSDWGQMNSLAPKLDSFISGAAFFLNRLGIPIEFGQALIAVVVVAFAMTTLDSGTRILRYNVEEIGRSFKFGFFKNRFVSSGVAVTAIAYFALMKIGGKPAGFTLWQLFGTTNQLLAGLGLLIITMYLYEKKKASIFIEIPMVFMFIVTFCGMVIKIKGFYRDRNYSLLVMGIILFLMTIWLITEAAVLYFNMHKKRIAAKKGVFDISSE